MTKYFYILLIVVFASCKKNEVKIKVNACFNYSTEATLKVGDTIQFSNCSENAISYHWDFGDGTTSVEKMPFHVFERRGNYTIKLKAINNSDFDSISKNISIDELKIQACFDYSLESILRVGDTIQFSNCSENANSYHWDFGDGSSASDLSPQHIFKDFGSYTVKLIASKYDGIDTTTKIIVVQNLICKAGVINSNMYASSFEPYSLSYYSNNLKKFDLNNNNSSDIGFSFVHISARTFYHEESYIDILDSTFQFIVTENLIYPRILNYNDTIDDNKLWSNQSKIIRNKWNNVTIASKSGFWDEPSTYRNYSYWLKKTGYIGIRNEYSKGQYKYGWLKLGVSDYLDITNYGYGYMK